MKILLLSFSFLVILSCAQAEISSIPEDQVEEILPLGGDEPAQVASEPASYSVPSIVITGVTERRVNFTVKNESSMAFYYLGWDPGIPAVSTQVRQGDSWTRSYFNVCGFGSRLCVLGPGESFSYFTPNKKEGPMRVIMHFSAEENEVSLTGVYSESHADWESN